MEKSTVLLQVSVFTIVQIHQFKLQQQRWHLAVRFMKTMKVPFETKKLILSGTFMPYDPVNDRSAPERLGFSVGKYLDGSVKKVQNNFD